MDIPLWLNITLQVIVALVIILILYIITLYALNIDAIVASANKGTEMLPNEATTIVDGYAGPGFLAGSRFNTVNHLVESFKKVSRSVNQNGGVSLTYQFWMKVEDPNDELFKDQCILLKGDKRKFHLSYYTPGTGASSSTWLMRRQMPPDSYVACPAIYFGDSYRQLKVRFNTNNDPFNEILIDMNKESEPSARKNLLSLLPITWTLLTFVFEDNYSPLHESANGLKFTFYVNDVPYWIETSSTSAAGSKLDSFTSCDSHTFGACKPQSTPIFKNDFLKQNDGDLHIFPDLKTTQEFCKLGNIKYYNSALSDIQIKDIFLKGPPKYAATNGKDTSVKPLYLSTLNKVDMYNY
jgi:hypothetical protein